MIKYTIYGLPFGLVSKHGNVYLLNSHPLRMCDILKQIQIFVFSMSNIVFVTFLNNIYLMI